MEKHFIRKFYEAKTEKEKNYIMQQLKNITGKEYMVGPSEETEEECLYTIIATKKPDESLYII